MDQLFNDKDQAIGDADLDTAPGQVAQTTEGEQSNGSKSDDPKFGEQLKQLEGIVTQLESGQMDLEDSMKAYGEGVHLIQSLQEKLSSAEQKMSVMMDEITPQG